MTQQTPEKDPAKDISAEVKTVDDAPTLPSLEEAAPESATAAPEPAAAPVTVPEPEAASAAPEPVNVPVPEPEPATAAPEPAAGPVTEPVAGPVTEPVAGPVTEPVAGPVTVPEPEPSAAPEPVDDSVTEPNVPTPATIHVPSPAALAARLHGNAAAKPSEHGRVDESGTVFVRTVEGEREVGSYPGATPAEALSYFTRKYDELLAAAELLLQRVTQTDLPGREGSEGLAKLREQTADARVVGDLAAMESRVAQIAAAVEAKKATEGAERSAARAAGKAKREQLVSEAEKIAAQPEAKIQWKTSGTRMRELLDEWKSMQRVGPKLDRASETALWQRFSAARNSFDKGRRVHFAQLEDTQSEAKSAKEKLVKEAEALATSKDWAPTATAFKRLMDRWREAGRASRSDDDALWARFKTAQDSFFHAKDELVAAENEEFKANLVVKEALLVEAEAILPVTDSDAAKAALRVIADKWERAGKVPRADMERVEKGIRRVEQAVRDHDEKRWASVNPEAAARAQSLVDQLELAVEGLRKDLVKAESSGDPTKVADAQSALEARQEWLAQARAGVQEFSG